MKPLFFACVKGGKVAFTDRERFDNYIRQFEGKNVQITIETTKTIRSNDQNRYYWLLLENLSNEIGHTTDELHNILKTKFLFGFICINGKEEKMVKSTTELTTVEFEIYLTKIREWASIELNIYLPLPNEVIL